MRQRTSWTEIEWRGKPVEECSRSELLELVEVLHGMVWESSENFARVHEVNETLFEQYGGRA